MDFCTCKKVLNYKKKKFSKKRVRSIIISIVDVFRYLFMEIFYVVMFSLNNLNRVKRYEDNESGI